LIAAYHASASFFDRYINRQDGSRWTEDYTLRVAITVIAFHGMLGPRRKDNHPNWAGGDALATTVAVGGGEQHNLSERVAADRTARANAQAGWIVTLNAHLDLIKSPVLCQGHSKTRVAWVMRLGVDKRAN
jgi:hypothetical protein